MLTLDTLQLDEVLTFVVSGALLVVQVINIASHLQRLLLDTSEVETEGNLAILMPPLHEVFIIAIDSDEITAPEGHIASSQVVDLTGVALGEEVAQEARAKAIQHEGQRKTSPGDLLRGISLEGLC